MLSTTSTNKNFHTEEDVKFIFNELRKASIIWSGRTECLRRARKKVFEGLTKRGKKKFKFHWQCAKCKEWFRNEADMEVDHITEIGGVTSFKGDWNKMMRAIFPRPVSKHLQCICVICHQKKTAAFMNARNRFERKRKFEE